MREIKFRGKRRKFDDWVVGDLNQNPVHYDCAIIQDGVISNDVLPETIGQYTGLKDKNGVEIYEGDILVVSGYDHGNYLPFSDEPDGFEYTLTGQVKYIPSRGFYLKISKRWDTDNDVEIKGKSKIGHICQSSCLLIGNIHQNPELL